MAMGEDEILELAVLRRGKKDSRKPGTWGKRGRAGTRYVRTPEGMEKYGLPMGAPITADAIARAKQRGRSYAVPEDDKKFGSQAPAAGRTSLNAREVVGALRTSNPRRVTPEGPKKIAVGGRGYGFPEGSRAYRSKKHENFAIVRTPDFELVVITEQGNAFELDGDLERELNAELDDDLSKIWLPDEPRTDLNGPDAGADDEFVTDSSVPDGVENMPGYLNEESIQAILEGVIEGGGDQDMADRLEIQLRRNNQRIEDEFAAQNPDGGDGSEDGIIDNPDDAPAQRMETVPSPTPDRQPKAGKAKPAAKSEDTPAPKDERTPEPKKAPAARRENTADEQLSQIEELSRSRPIGTADGPVGKRRAAVRRNRVDDTMEYDLDGERLKSREEVLARIQEEADAEAAANAAPRDTTNLDPADMTDQELEDVLADLHDAMMTGNLSVREALRRTAPISAERARRGLDVEETPEVPDPDPAPETVGKPVDTQWATSAKPGASAITSSGLAATKQDDGSWDSPIGALNDNFFAPTNVENDDIYSTREQADDRPLGATRQIETVEDLATVRPTDGVVVRLSAGGEMTGYRNANGTFTVELSGLRVPDMNLELLLSSGSSAEIWHVPNQDIQEPTKSTWAAGDKIRAVADLLAQKIGTRLRLRPIRRELPPEELTVAEDGHVQSDSGLRFPGTVLKPAMADGRLSIAEVETRDLDPVDIDPPRVVTDPSLYETGDSISDYRHLREMAPGTQLTLTVPAHRNGGREAQVTLTRTDDEAKLGGFMFLVGDGGRGYNSFGENNASIFQAIYEGRLRYGNMLGDRSKPEKIAGAGWSREKNISLWDDGPNVSEYDLRTFIASQVASRAMQSSYYDTSLLPDDNPFRSRELRDEFSALAIKKYSVEGNPARHKPAMIRLAAEKLGLEYTEPGSTLIPDDLTMEDFNTPVTVGRWLRSTGTAAEANMGPEQLQVTRADLKTALAVLNNMADPGEGGGDPDKILKRVFARQGSPFQDLNVSVAIASYFQMRRTRINDDGTETNMTTIARQYDKRRNRELLRQMLREQLEGVAPGTYGIPEDEAYTRNDGKRFVNRSTLETPSAPAATATPETTPEVTPEPQNPAAAPAATADAPAAPTTRLTPERRAELDGPDENPDSGAAFRNAVDNGDALEYIEDVLGEAGVRALDDGSVSLRRQFYRAWLDSRSKRSSGVSPTPSEPEVPAPVSEEAPRTAFTPGTEISSADFGQLGSRAVVDYVRSNGTLSRYTRQADGTWQTQSGTTLSSDPSTWRNARFQVVDQGTTSGPGEAQSDTSVFRAGDSFTGSRVRELPIGAHIQGRSGREYVVDERGIRSLNGGDLVSFDAVASFNAPFNYLGDSAPTAPTTTAGQVAVSARVGARVTPDEIRDMPDGSIFRGGTGAEYVRQGDALVNRSTGRRMSIDSLPGRRYSYRGVDTTTPTPTTGNRAATASDLSRPLEELGYSRVSQADIERYDQPRPRPAAGFNADDTRPLAEFIQSPEFSQDISNTLAAVLPEGSTISAQPTSDGFLVSYTLPNGASVTMHRTVSGTRVSNEVARATGSNSMMAEAQDALFQFYAQHGITDIEVHGYTSASQDTAWNGAHTWPRRGFRPDPNNMGQNYTHFSGLRDNLARVVDRIRAGSYPQYQEFLDEAESLQIRATQLLNRRQNMRLDQQVEEMYQIWRAITYLGEVRDSNGKTVRGARQSIGWRLLGAHNGTYWYYGLRSLQNYFD